MGFPFNQRQYKSVQRDNHTTTFACSCIETNQQQQVKKRETFSRFFDGSGTREEPHETVRNTQDTSHGETHRARTRRTSKTHAHTYTQSGTIWTLQQQEQQQKTENGKMFRSVFHSEKSIKQTTTTLLSCYRISSWAACLRSKETYRFNRKVFEEQRDSVQSDASNKHGWDNCWLIIHNGSTRIGLPAKTGGKNTLARNR